MQQKSTSTDSGKKIIYDACGIPPESTLKRNRRVSRGENNRLSLVLKEKEKNNWCYKSKKKERRTNVATGGHRLTTPIDAANESAPNHRRKNIWKELDNSGQQWKDRYPPAQKERSFQFPQKGTPACHRTDKESWIASLPRRNPSPDGSPALTPPAGAEGRSTGSRGTPAPAGGWWREGTGKGGACCAYGGRGGDGMERRRIRGASGAEGGGQPTRADAPVKRMRAARQCSSSCYMLTTMTWIIKNVILNLKDVWF